MQTVIDSIAPRGKFITVEGGEGAGKSTAVAFIQAQLDAKCAYGYKATREPGGTPLAEAMRAMLLTHQEEQVDAYTELLLMFAARRQHVSQVIEPALHAGQYVLCDRFTDATYAYQGYGRGLPLGLIDELAMAVHGQCQPDLTLLLDVDIDVGMGRVQQRQGDHLDRIESEQRSFFERVREGYLSRAQQDPQRFCVINASGTLADVQTQLKAALERVF